MPSPSVAQPGGSRRKLGHRVPLAPDTWATSINFAVSHSLQRPRIAAELDQESLNGTLYSQPHATRRKALTIQITDSELQAALPDLESTVRLPGLASPAAVYRDRWGIPPIRAHSEWDLVFAQGFAAGVD